jgi:hypothetical protein
MAKKSKKPKKSEVKIDLLQNLEDRLKDIYSRNHAMDSEEQKEVEQIKEKINNLKN